MIETIFLIIVFFLIIEFIGGLMGSIRKSVEIIRIMVPYRDYPHEEGFLELGHGQSEIFVPTTQQPLHVWLNLNDYEGIQCCLGQVNMLSTYSTPEGFVVIANITSESAYVKWIAEFV